MVKDSTEKVLFYSTSWCGDCLHSRHILKDSGIEFEEINIDKDEESAKKVMSLNNGYRSVPTIVFPDGTILVEPSNQELLAQINNPGE